MSQGFETDVHEFLDDLDAGVFSDRLGRALSEVAAGVCDHGGKKKGKVLIELKFSRVGGAMVNIEHVVKYERPTRYGKVAEESGQETPMHVGRGGKLSFMPQNQQKLFTDGNEE